MKTVKRIGLFETNSSSTHSFSIDDDPVTPETLSKLPIDADGKCYVFPGEFGWEERKYLDSATKASYLWTFLAQMKHNNQRAIKSGCAKKAVPRYRAQIAQADGWLKVLREVIQKRTGCEATFMYSCNEESTKEGEVDGYIDHQSFEMSERIFKRGADAVDRFIFSVHSVLETDNDNH